MQPISLSQSMQLLPCTQYQTYGCCYATSITQLNIKHAAIAMQPITLSSNIQLLPCIQNQACICCHATNITQLKHAAIAMHMIPNMNCCYATNITQLEHTAIAMHTKLSMLLLLCNQYHSG